jgi:hypothetical protein
LKAVVEMLELLVNRLLQVTARRHTDCDEAGRV